MKMNRSPDLEQLGS